MWGIARTVLQICLMVVHHIVGNPNKLKKKKKKKCISLNELVISQMTRLYVKFYVNKKLMQTYDF